MFTGTVAKLMLCGAGMHEGRLPPKPSLWSKYACELFNNSLTATKLDANMSCDGFGTMSLTADTATSLARCGDVW